MKKNGFKRYNAILNCEFEDMPELTFDKVAKSPEDLILDSIFCKDENGFPCTSFAKLLSNKTSDDIRRYIQENIMIAKHENSFISDENILQEFKKLDSSFLAEVSRNRFESIEAYEQRIGSYIENARSEAESQKRIARYKEYFKLDKSEK